MNDNYIAPEAFDESNYPECKSCGYISNTIEEKISYYRGRCACCKENPCNIVKKAPRTYSSIIEDL